MEGKNKHFGIGYGLAWVSVAICVAIAINITKSTDPLFAFFIPLCISTN